MHLEVTDAVVDLDAGLVDVAILYGLGRYPKAHAERILEETVTPVCSPGYLSQVGGLSTPARLVRCSLLHEVPMTANWAAWFVHAAVRDVRTLRGPTYSHGSMAVDAAIRGEGVPLGRSVLVAEDIAAGRLVAPFRASSCRWSAATTWSAALATRKVPRSELFASGWRRRPASSWREALSPGCLLLGRERTCACGECPAPVRRARDTCRWGVPRCPSQLARRVPPPDAAGPPSRPLPRWRPR